ncbi:thioredoxin family protein [Candidatus Sumerlaeota bacterium]|nr:thioredoxin family protein [Candidatus Sumerlaeota bacterium]
MRKTLILTAAVLLLSSATAWAQLADPFGIAASLETRGDQTVLAVSFTIPEGHYLYADSIRVEADAPFALEPLDVPPPKKKHDPFSEAVREVYDRDLAQTFRVVPSPDAAALKATVAYQGCSESLCFLPSRKVFDLIAGSKSQTPPSEATSRPRSGLSTETQTGKRTASPDLAPSASAWSGEIESFAPPVSTVGYLGKKPFLEFLDRALSSDASEPERLGGGLLLTLLGILVGGLLLNLTPCVLPLIPINVAIIGAGARAGSRLRGFALGAAYGAGIALTYGLLGVVAVVSGSTFGTLNASPWFNLSIAAVFLALSLAMFNVYSIDFSRLRSGRTAKKKGPGGSFGLAVFMGSVAALLAGACVAPVILSVLLLSARIHAAGNPFGLLLPFLLGVGMALPWPFAGAGLSFLPKPGGWMTWVERGFGVVVLVFAVYYGWLGARLWSERLAPEAARELAAERARLASDEGWFVELGPALAQARREGRPVFIDFWASWCKSCLAMDKTTFRDPEARARLDTFVKVKFQAEDPSNPRTAEVLERFGVGGLPTYVILRPQPGE